MRTARLAGIGAGVLILAGVGIAFAAPPDTYTPPCTANTDSCRQRRIIALENHYKTHNHPSDMPTATVSPTPADSPTPTEATISPSTPPTSPATGFITATGRDFIKDGQPFRFHGFNSYGMTGCYNGSPYTTAQLDAYFSNLPANGVTRLWAFRSYGTAKVQAVLDSAAKHDQHVILTLADGISSCGETDNSVSGDHTGKTATYYESGWKNEWSTWVRTIVPLFKNDPTILMWEIINEPGQRGAVPSLNVWQNYLTGTSGLIRSLDSNHLIGVGANITKNFGGTSNFTTLMGLPNIDAVSFHDYAYEYEGGTAVSGNFNTAKSVSTTVNKPFYGGEAGQPAGASGCAVNPTSRAAHMKTKADAYFTGGVDGLLYWEYAPNKASWVGNCAHEMYPTDPMVSQVRTYATVGGLR